MRTGKNLLVVSIIVICCFVIIWFSTSIEGSQRTYEVQPNISIPEHKTDTVRVIDAYERLMERYMDLTERNIEEIDTDVKTVIYKLESIEKGIKDLSDRMARIEKALGITQQTEPPKTATEKQNR